MTSTDDLKNKPWFKNPMVWMVIFFPSLAVVAGISTIFIALATEDGLVVDDYYKEGLQINRIIKYDKKARELGLSAFVDTNANTGEILVSLEADEKLELQDTITYRLIHRTRSGLDQFTTLSQVGNSADFRGYIKPPVIEGRWSIQIISKGNWRLKQNFTTKDADNILMNITS
ncbi:MAG: FixH family protein [Gammaproteobacteria bacterium]|nr:FixH family protein [Gammaproteobacteria bacterium]